MITMVNLLRKMQDVKRKRGLKMKFEELKITPMTRVFAENDDGDCFILTNNQVVTFEDLQVKDLGCHINVTLQEKTNEMSIMVLTKHEFFGEVKTKVDLEAVKNYKTVG